MAISRSADFTPESSHAPVNDAFGSSNFLTSEDLVHRELRQAIEPPYKHVPLPRILAH